MANIVTQLQNKNGDNLYPLAGGMAADSITTAMLQDGSVTAAKLDSETISLGAGSVSLSNVSFLRVGNIAILNVQTVAHAIALQETYGTIPASARPSVSVVFAGIVQGTGASCSIAITSSTGVINLQACPDIPTANNRVAFSVVYKIG